MLFLAQEVVQVVSSCYRDARGNNRIMIRWKFSLLVLFYCSIEAWWYH